MRAVPEERRTSARTPTDRPGLIHVGNVTIHCTIRDISALGAGLRLPIGLTVPNAFELQLDDGQIMPVRVAWRAYPNCGVAFVGAPAVAGFAKAPAERPRPGRLRRLLAPILGWLGAA